MTQARTALNEGNREKARAAYRTAAQTYPTEKLPWQRLSEDYFNAQDYGNAVIAAQEVLQRDGQDNLAHSILAVSGLRLTAGSLLALRQDTTYSVGSRDEAITVARALRDTLGAAALLPPPASNNPAQRLKKPAPSAASVAVPAVVQRQSAAAPSTLPTVVPVAATTLPATKPSSPAPAGNPLDKLK